MARKCFLGLMIAALLVSFTLPAVAQESAVKGNLAGTIYDTSGAVVPGAKVTITGPTGTTSKDSDERGDFSLTLLIPGFYSVKVEKEGFKAADVKSVEVFTGRTSSIRVTLEPGAITQVVEISVPAVTVDTSSTGVGANLPDSFYHSVPVTRNVAGLFYLSAGVASGGLSGRSNPSISGGSGLENLYVADGVNITDTSFGGIGTFSRVFGSLGTGINLSFVKEVQVKTAGYEPQYGKATGGIVQIVTKSGGRDYHGAIAGYIQPREFESTRLHPDDFGRVNLAGKTLNQENFDASAELGGYVPSMRDKLFFFGSVNPGYARDYALAPPSAGLFSRGEMNQRTNTLSYAGKLTYRINDKHTVEGSVWGDPAHTSTAALRTLNTDNTTSWSRLDYGTRSVVGRWNGTLTPTWLVNASFTWNFNRFTEGNFANMYQVTDRTQIFGAPGQRGIFTPVGLGFLENTEGNNYAFNVDTQKQYHFGGDHTFSIGYRLERPFYEGIRDRSGPRAAIPATNAVGGAYGLPAGAAGQMSNYTFSIRLANDPFFPLGTSLNPGPSPARQCSLCPFMSVPGITGPGPGGAVRVFLRNDRGEFTALAFKTEETYHAAYAQDSWSMNKYVTVNLGLRWEQEHMKGQDLSYTWTDAWSPRVGVIADPWGNRKTKIYANFGRYNYAIPLDMALRSLSNELDFIGVRWAPQFTVDASGRRIVVINSFGTVNPVPDAAHLLSRANTSQNDSTCGTPAIPPNPPNPPCNFNPPLPNPNHNPSLGVGVCVNPQGCGTGGAPFVAFQSTTGIARGTKMEYVDEFVVGIDREFKGGVIVSGRYIDRRMKRIVEDMSGIGPEAFSTNINQIYLIGNVNAKTDLFTNPIGHVYDPSGPVPSQCTDPGLINDAVTDSFGNVVPPGAVCYESTGVNGQPPGADVPDGVPDGFPDPKRIYQAVEIEVNKAFSHNWQMRANWRIAKLFGNFEGAFRNDNGQTDPSISSLFDFVQGQFSLLGDQFTPGVLNTDRRHVVNFYMSYVVDRSVLKGMELGTGVRIDTGAPINDLKAHPAYLNSGEVPVNGRGSLGRLPTTGSVDIHVAYPFRVTERMKLKLGMDLFNIANSRRQLRIDEFEDASFGVRNLDFKKPVGRTSGFQRPFYARAMVRLEF